jgi:hypothetical protein
MGSPALWEHHKRNYNPKHDTPDEPLKPKDLKKKSTAPQVVVVKTDSEGKRKKKV